MTDHFKSHSSGLDSPPSGGFAITPNDSADLPITTRGINVAASGDVRITTVDGSEITLFIVAGIPFPIRARKVWATGTAASSPVGLF